MYTTSDFKRGLRIEIDGQPYSIIEFEHHKPGKGASIVRTRLRNLVTGQVTAPTFRAGDKVGTPDIEDKAASSCSRPATRTRSWTRPRMSNTRSPRRCSPSR